MDRCFWLGHKWSKWKQRVQDMIYIPRDGRQPVQHTQAVQERECEHCGKQQREDIG